jgi:LmbE family N-acetylglucosaminyl deacetylase
MNKAFEPVHLASGNPPVLLAVLAHPDDETFGMGGTLALYARRGVQVYLICATRGEVGQMDPALMAGFDSVASRREMELRCAAEKLGLAGVFFLDYRDSGMPGTPDNAHPQALAAQPLDEVARRVVTYMRKLRPQVVVTFDPIGGYRHPDHIAIQRATERAFALSGQADFVDDEQQPPFEAAKLYFHTIPRGVLRVMVRVLPLLGRDPRRFGENGDIDLVSIAEVDFPTHAVVRYDAVVGVRDEASACHVSQGGQRMSGGLLGWLRRLVGATERFMRAYPPPKQGEQCERDLFAGL